MELTKDNAFDTISYCVKDLDGIIVNKDNDALAICKDGEKLFTLSLPVKDFPYMLSEYTFPDGKSTRIMSLTFPVDCMGIEDFSGYLKCFTSVCDKAHRSVSDFISGKSRTDEEITEFMRDVNKTAKKEYCICCDNLEEAKEKSE